MRTLFASLALFAFAIFLRDPAGAAGVKQASFVLDANTGSVLHEQFADAPRKPASLTKMMTLYLAFAEIEAGRLSYASKLVVSEKAAGVAPSKLELAAGEEIALIDAIKALITKSANDMAVAIAERVGGTEANFARLMTAKAHAIGMGSTRFVNASGLPDDRQLTTARDMVTLGLRLQEDFPEHYKLFSLKEFSFRGKVYRTHNTLMPRFPGMDGIKTGYTRASGFNLVSSVRADGKHLVAAVFGGTTAETRNAHMRSLLFHALDKASSVRTRPAGPVLVARAQPAERAAKQVGAAPSVSDWKTDARAVPAPKPLRKPVLAGTAARPSPPPARRDQIAAVLANADTVAPAEPYRSEDLSPPPHLNEGITSLMVSSASAAGVAKVPASALARPASTLGEQAQSLQVQPVAPSPPITFARANSGVAPSHLSGPVDAVASPGRAAALGYEIQIGAFASSEEAEAKLNAVKTKAGALLSQHEGVARSVLKGDRRLYRARFLAFDEAKASQTCLELRRMAIDCLVTKTE